MIRTALSLLTLLLVPCSLTFGADLYSVEFSQTALGKLPAGWKDMGIQRSSPNWAVDGEGFLRVIWKGENGLISYAGVLANDTSATELKDATLSAKFKKTPDEEVYAAVAGRISDAKNFYAVRFSGDSKIELVKIVNGKEEILADWVTRSRLPEKEVWTLSLTLKGNRITGQVFDTKGIEQARVDALDEKGFKVGAPGLGATNFTAFQSFQIIPLEAVDAKLTPDQIQEKNTSSEPAVLNYQVLKPAVSVESLNTPFEKLAEKYDVIIAGAGTSGWAAALQASRMGVKVLLLEESDWIGGQMAAAAVTSMDEEGCWEKFPVRERGIYREFHESMINHYYTMDKDPFRAYYAWPEQLEGGYEPKVVRAVLYAFIAEARKTETLDLAIRSAVTEVKKEGDTITGVMVQHITDSGEVVKRDIASKVLIEATEYGDVLPLTGARYRVGNTSNDNLDPESLVQYHTWVGVMREYPEGIPDHLQMKEPPPGYLEKRYRGSQLYGAFIWGGAGRDIKGPRTYRVLFAWRGMADGDSPTTGMPTQYRHSQCGLNGGRQDYPVSAASIEDPKARYEGERDGIYRTLSEIYYFQKELGLPWSVADDEGFDTAHNKRTMDALEIREDLKPLAVNLPQWPYVREARRARGIYTLRAADLGRFENATLFPTAVAMGDYYMDLDHGPTGHAVETDLDEGEAPKGGGPFQVPFEVFIPEKINGLVLAEKNISQSRLVNGATRLQPITILNGQAAGAIAALAVLKDIQPREVNPVSVQVALLRVGSNLIQRWYEDIAWGTDLWQATQLLSLYQVMDPPGPFVKGHNTGMGTGQFWKADESLNAKDFSSAVTRLAELANKKVSALASDEAPAWAVVEKTLSQIDPGLKTRLAELNISSAQPVKRGDFAMLAAAVLGATAKPVLLADAQ